MSDSNDECDDLSDKELAQRLASHMGQGSSVSDHVSSQVDVAQSATKDLTKQAQTQVELISNASRCRVVCDILLGADILAVDIEGVRLGRHGEICIIQVADRHRKVYLFDVTTLGKMAFQAGLKAVLEADNITKLFFDIRCDADALYHLYNVKLNNVLDMQVLCHKAKGGYSMFVQGIAKALTHVLPSSELQLMKGAKETGQSLFAPDRGGYLEIWRKRPLSPALRDYCAQDVVHLLTMLDKWEHCLARSTLRTVSEIRMRKRMHSRVVETGPQLARIDFEFPPDITRMKLTSQARPGVAKATAPSKAVSSPPKLKPTVTAQAAAARRNNPLGNKVWIAKAKATTTANKVLIKSVDASPAKGARPSVQVPTSTTSSALPKPKPTVMAKDVAKQPLLKPMLNVKDVAAVKANHALSLPKPVQSGALAATGDEPPGKRQRQGELGTGSSFQ
jgi:exonuclease 3'-5' domain-containing protein 1